MQAVAASLRLLLGERVVVGDAEELDHERDAIEDREFRELVRALARGVDGAGVEEVLAILPEDHGAGGGELADQRADDFVDLRAVGVPLETDAPPGENLPQVL